MSSGKISQVIGPVVDVEFAGGENLPEINNALIVYKDNGDNTKTKIVLEVNWGFTSSNTCAICLDIKILQ